MDLLCLLVPLLLSVSGAGSNEVPVSVRVPRRVSGMVGSSVVLPCKFNSSYSHYTTFEITVIWKIEVFYTGTVLFNSTNRVKNHDKEFENIVHTNVNDRYGLAGDPRQYDASLELKHAMLDDNSQYFCRVEVKRQGLLAFMDETNPGTILEVTGPPAILNLSITAVNATQFTLVCLVEGEPSPNIMWIDPHNNRLPVNGSNTPVMQGPGKYQIVGELHGPKLRGNYSCVATNSQGSVVQAFYFTSIDGERSLFELMIYVSVGSVVLIILVAIALVIWKRKRERAKFTPQKERYQPNSPKYCKAKLYQLQSIPEVTCTAETSTEVNSL